MAGEERGALYFVGCIYIDPLDWAAVNKHGDRQDAVMIFSDGVGRASQVFLMSVAHLAPSGHVQNTS